MEVKITLVNASDGPIRMMLCLVIMTTKADLGGVPTHAPYRTQFFCFAYIFTENAHVGGQNPPKMGPRPSPTENPGSGPVYV